MRSRRGRGWRGERGQSTAFVLTLLFVLVLFVGVVVNVGQAVNRRIALQTIADTGAFTGATVMAVGLNNMAYWNSWIQEAWAVMTWAYVLTLAECAAPKLYNVAAQILSGVIQVENFLYQGIPRMEADRVSAYNAVDLFPGEMLDFRESDLSPEAGIIFPARNMLNLYPLERVDDGSECYSTIPEVFNAQESLWCWEPCGPFCIRIENVDMTLWFRKSTESVQAFVWIAIAPETPFLFMSSLFGNIPEMKAAAAAKPVGGSIEEGTSEYVAKMIPMSEVTLAGIIYDDIYDRYIRPVLH